MNAPSYPIQLQLAGRRVLVVGGGRVATRKVERLLESGAALRVVAPEVTEAIERLAARDELELALRRARPEDVSGSFLVFAATDDGAVNEALAAWARARGVLVSRVDAPEDSDFTLPALVRGAHVEATVSTYGSAPSASRRLGRELGAWIEGGADRFAGEVAAVRRVLRGDPEAPHKLRQLTESELYEACAARDEARIRALVVAVLGERT